MPCYISNLSCFELSLAQNFMLLSFPSLSLLAYDEQHWRQTPDARPHHADVCSPPLPFRCGDDVTQQVQDQALIYGCRNWRNGENTTTRPVWNWSHASLYHCNGKKMVSINCYSTNTNSTSNISDVSIHLTKITNDSAGLNGFIFALFSLAVALNS
jgi:hypothetical protein